MASGSAPPSGPAPCAGTSPSPPKPSGNAPAAYAVKACLFGALVALASNVARRYMRSRLRRPAGGDSCLQHNLEEQQEGSSSKEQHAALDGAAKGPPAPDSALRIDSGELSLLGSFAQESWKALSSLSRSSASTSSAGGSSSARGAGGSNSTHTPFFDSAASRSTEDAANVSVHTSPAGSGGQLSYAPSSLVTDVTKLPHDWNIVEFGELELAKTIGEGSFGQVWLAKYCQTIVAVKVLNHNKAFNATNSMHERTMMRALSKEVSIMASLRHPNCTQYLGVCLEPPCLLMEYCSRKSVDNILSAAATDPKLARQLTWARVLGMAADAAKGMLYLHSRHPPILHRDLKSANLLVDAHWHVKVADFNLSRADDHSVASTVAITNPRWLAPEVLLGGQAQLASDVWAFGTVLWELMTWQLPFEKHNPFQIIVTVTNADSGSGLPIPKPEELPAGPFASYPQYVELMQACWARDPGDRPSMDAVVSALLPMLSSELRRSSSGTASGSLGPGNTITLGTAGSLGAATPNRSACTVDRTAAAGPSREPSTSDGSEPAAAACMAAANIARADSAGPPLSPLLNIPRRPRRRSVDLLQQSEREAMPTPFQGEVLESMPTMASPFGSEAQLSRRDSVQPPLQQGPPSRNATQELLDGGYCTVGNAGLSQMNSGSPAYPFVNSGFFARMQSELLE